LKGFELTDILPFGGIITQLKVDAGTQTLMTFIPEFPIYPPETAWMREPKTNIPGMIDCNIYKQEGRLVIHLVNLTSAATWRQPLDEYIPVGPITVKVKLPEGINGEFPNLLVTGQRIIANVSEGWSQFQIASILNHELVVIT